MQKRPQMALISESFSDLTIVTNDNPRNEDPAEIAKQVISGFQKKSYLVELDRKKAIMQALELAKPDDIILIAGKGHETYQIFAHQTIVFDDREIVKEACRGEKNMINSILMRKFLMVSPIHCSGLRKRSELRL